MNQDLLSKAQKILSSDLFSQNVEDCTLAEKQNLFLALSGTKPVSFVSSSHLKNEMDLPRELEADEPAFVTEFLTSLGLKFKLFTDEYSTDALVSLNEEYLNKLSENPTDAVLSGQLYGYPKSAIDAFATEDKSLRLSEEEEEKALTDAGVPLCFPHFHLSKANFSEEINVIKKWQQVCSEYGLV